MEVNEATVSPVNSVRLLLTKTLPGLHAPKSYQLFLLGCPKKGQGQCGVGSAVVAYLFALVVVGRRLFSRNGFNSFGYSKFHRVSLTRKAQFFLIGRPGGTTPSQRPSSLL